MNGESTLGYVINYYPNRGTVDIGTFDGCNSWKDVPLDPSLSAFTAPVLPVIDNSVSPARIKKYGSLLILDVFSSNLVKIIRLYNEDSDLQTTKEAAVVTNDPVLNTLAAGSTYLSAPGHIDAETLQRLRGSSLAMHADGTAALLNDSTSAGLILAYDGSVSLMGTAFHIEGSNTTIQESDDGIFTIALKDVLLTLSEGYFGLESQYNSISCSKETASFQFNGSLTVTAGQLIAPFDSAISRVNTLELMIYNTLRIHLPNGQRLEMDASGCKIYASSVKLGMADGEDSKMYNVLCTTSTGSTVKDLSEIKIASTVQAACL